MGDLGLLNWHVLLARDATENLTGMQDTHTELSGVTVMPRWAANHYSRLRTGDDYRTWLYSREGYVELFQEAGFPNVRLLDLVASYNDYDFVLDPDDVLSYKLLYGQKLVRSFYRPAAGLRHAIHRLRPSWLGAISYAYHIVAGDSVSWLLDPSHPLWAMLQG